MAANQIGELRQDELIHSGVGAEMGAEILDERATNLSCLHDTSEFVEALYCLIVRIAGPWYRRRVAPSDVEDRLHDTFLIVLDAVRSGALRDTKALPGFVKTVLRFQAMASIREVRRRRRNVTLSGFDAGGLRGNPEELFAKCESKRLLQLFLDRQPARDRELLTRFYLMEQPWEQICVQMNLTPNQFRLGKWRAKERLIQASKTDIDNAGRPWRPVSPARHL